MNESVYIESTGDALFMDTGTVTGCLLAACLLWPLAVPAVDCLLPTGTGTGTGCLLAAGC